MRPLISFRRFASLAASFARKDSFRNILILLLVNIGFALRYLISSSSEIPGFPYRMDGYSYPLFATLFIDLVHKGIVPLGNIWVPQVAAGHAFFLIPDPLFAAYSTILLMTGDFILTYKILLFLLYFASGITSYYFASILLANRVARLVSAVSYTFSQTTLYEVSLGHLSIVYGMVLIPLILGFLLKGYRDGRLGLSILSGLSLFFLIIEREDYGYMMIGFILILLVYHLIFRRGMAKSVVLNTGLALSIAILFSAPYLQQEIFSKLSLWERVGTSYRAYSPSILQLFFPVFSNVEGYLGDITIILAGICVCGLLSRVRPISFSYENKFYLMLSLVACLFVVLGLGSSTPVYGTLYSYLPSFTGFRAAAGNPTYWLQPSKLCFSVLAGGSCAFLRKIQLRSGRATLRFSRLIVTILIIVIVFDGGTFLAASEPYSPIVGWSSIGPGPSHYNVYQFIQTAPVPAGAGIYNYIAKDPGDYNVVEIPYIYTLPDFQYLSYLHKTKSDLLNPYGVPEVPAIFPEIYSSMIAASASAGNATILASDLALIGVKYVVYEGFWGGPNLELGLRQPTTPFQFIMKEGNVSLFRNLSFGLNYELPNIMLDPSFETPNSSIWQPWNLNDSYNCVFACFVNGVSFEGSNSLKEVTTNNGDVSGRNQFINSSSLTPGKYILSGWNKALNVSPGSEVGLRVIASYENGTDVTLAYAPFHSGTHDWQYSDAILNIASTRNLTQLAVSTYLRSGTGTTWVDDVEFQRIQSADAWNGAFAVKSLYGDSGSTIAQQNLVDLVLNWTRTSQMEMGLNIGLGEPAFLVLPFSYDPGWNIKSDLTGETFNINQYDGLMEIQLGPGTYHLSLLYGAHDYSLYQTSIIYIFGAVVCVTPVLHRHLGSRTRRRAIPPAT